MPREKNKYDIAFSMAEEDLPIAKLIAAEFKTRNISYYLYTEKEHRAANLGKSLLQITQEVYGGMAKYVVMITSQTFAIKYWASIERQYTQHYGKGKDAYLLQVKLDDTAIDGLSKYIVFEPWNNNAAEIADIIAKKLKLAKKKRLVGVVKWVTFCFILFTFAAAILKFVMLPKGTTVLNKTVIENALGNKPKPDPLGTGGKIGQLGANNKVKPLTSQADTPTISAKSPLQQPQNSDIVKVPSEKASQQSDYCILVTGSNPDLNNMVASGIREHILAKQWSITKKQGEAKKIVKVAMQIETKDSESVAGMVASSCNYQFSILKTDGSVVAEDAGRFVKPGFTVESNIYELSSMVLQKVNKFL